MQIMIIVSVSSEYFNQSFTTHLHSKPAYLG